MAKLHIEVTSDLKVEEPIKALHVGRLCLVGKKARKRFIYQGERGGLYVKNVKQKKRYLSQGGLYIITNVVKGAEND